MSEVEAIQSIESPRTRNSLTDELRRVFGLLAKA